MSNDRMTQEMQRKAAAVGELSEDHLALLITDAAKDFGTYAMWPDLPRTQQGDRHPQAVAIREERREASRALWLAAMRETARRRALAK